MPNFSVGPSEDPIVTSRANPVFKRLRALAQSTRRQRDEQIVWLEGPHLIRALLDAGWPVGDWAVSTQVPPTGEIASLLAGGRRAGARITRLDPALFAQICPASDVGAIIAVAPIPEAAPVSGGHGDAVVLDAVQDAGNVGAILRTAVAAGVRRVFLTPGCAYPWGSKVLRAGMGAHFALPLLAEAAPEDIAAALGDTLMAVTALQSANSIYRADLRPAVAWVFGNEGAGVSTFWREQAALRLFIPQTDGVESLNVAAAAAVCLFEQRRQRLAGAG